MATYQERYDSARPSYIRVNDKKFADLPAGTTVLIPSPSDIEHELNGLAADEHITLTELRQRLAERHDADGTCPVMCGMNLRIVAELALEALDAGLPKAEVVPVLTHQATWPANFPAAPPASPSSARASD